MSEKYQIKTRSVIKSKDGKELKVCELMPVFIDLLKKLNKTNQTSNHQHERTISHAESIKEFSEDDGDVAYLMGQLINDINEYCPEDVVFEAYDSKWNNVGFWVRVQTAEDYG